MPRPHRVTTAIRFDPPLHEALKETSDELMVSLNWLVCKLCEEGLERIDLTKFSLVRPGNGEAVQAQPESSVQ
jgi:hypothetical protein